MAEAAAAPAVVRIGGVHVAIRNLANGAPAFQNRRYAWKAVPEQFNGWSFTQTKGGIEAAIVVKAVKGGMLYAAASGDVLEAAGWTRVKGVALGYTDKTGSSLAVWCKPVEAGAVLEIPQAGWPGTLVLAPDLRMRPPKDPFDVPGVVVSYSPSRTHTYIGCPSIAVLPNGEYVASHSHFGKGCPSNLTRVFTSKDRGVSWTHLTDLEGQWWSTLFVHQGALYIMGTTGKPDFQVVIRRSADGGRTWSTPTDANSGLLIAEKGYHTAPVPVVVHKGRVWRGMERMSGGFSAFVMSAPAAADLLKAENWTISNRLLCTEQIPDCPKWLEGNVVVAPDGGIVNVLRLQYPGGDKAGILHVSEDGKTVSFDLEKDIVAMPGAHHKFTIRHDPKSGRYWSLVNLLTKPEDAKDSDAIWYYRNVLGLISSADLREWRTESVLLANNRGRALNRANNKVGFQYVDWLFDGDDIIAVSRTAWGDEVPRSHDANYLTFHRVPGFRTRTMQDPPFSPGENVLGDRATPYQARLRAARAM